MDNPRTKNPALVNRSLRKGSMKTGCLIALGVFLFLLIGGGIFVAMSYKSWIATGMKSLAAQVVADSGLPADQQARITARIDAVADDYKAGKFTAAQFESLGGALKKSPLLPFGLASSVVAEKSLARTGLTPDEKKDAALQIKRFGRALVDNSLTLAQVESVTKPVVITDGQGNPQLKVNPPDADIRKFIQNMKDKADEFKVAADPTPIDVADEVIKIIDAAAAAQPSPK